MSLRKRRKRKTTDFRTGFTAVFTRTAGVILCLMVLMPCRPVSAANLSKLDVDVWRPGSYIRGLHIGSTVEEIADNTFINQIELATIGVSEDNPHFSSFSNCLYDKDRTILICFPQALLAAEIPPTVIGFNWFALYGVDPRIQKGVLEAIRKNAERQGTAVVYVKDREKHLIETWPYTLEYPVLTP